MTSEVLVCPDKFTPLKRHWYRNGGVPPAVTLNVALWSRIAVVGCGCETISGGNWTTSVADKLVTEPAGFETVTLYCPASDGKALRSVKVALVAFAIGAPLKCHW